MMKAKRKGLPLILLVVCLALTGCAPRTQSNLPGEESEAIDNLSRSVPKAAPLNINDAPFTEDKSVYSADDPTSLVYFYATIRRGSDADGTNHSLEDVNSFVHLQGMAVTDRIMAEVLLQEGDEYGPLPDKLGYGETEVNGTIRVRGRTSTHPSVAQKSYRIDLFDSAGLWRNQRAIALLKHVFEPTRMMNKLYFDLLKDVPDVPSLRTQFVHLFVKDETAVPPATEFVDYGLFTFVETPNRRFLRNHGLNREGNLYKAEMFEFYRYPNEIRLATDPLYDQALFDSVLEVKNGLDHRKLIEMLDAVNNFSLPIETVVERYFNVDNIMSFLAFNLLMGNADFNSQNFLLYSPVASDTWYFLLWDGDGSLAYTSDEILGNDTQSWQKGLSVVWEVQLFNRMFRVEAYREQLLARIELLRGIITAERIEEMVRAYRQVVDPFVARMPDGLHMPVASEQREQICESVPYDTDKAYAYFLESLKKPMPFFLDDVTGEAGALYFTWEEAFDFNAQLVHYDFQLCTDWTFEEEKICFQSLDMFQLVMTVDTPLPPGEYWWRVVARNASGKTQIAFDKQETAAGLHEGVRKFRITEDGQVEND